MEHIQLTLIILEFGYPPYSFDGPSKIIKLGGYFTPFYDDGQLNQNEIECLAAFLMAIEEINANPNLLPNSQIVTAVRSGNGYYSATDTSFNFVNAFYDTGIIGLINSMSNTEAIASTGLLRNVGGIVQLLSKANDSSLSNFQYNTQLVPLDSYDGHVLQKVLCNYYKYNIITIFSTNDIYGINSLAELISGEYCTFNILDSYSFSIENIDFTQQIENSITHGGLIFIILTSATNAALILSQGTQLGLFTDKTQIFGSSKVVTSELLSLISENTKILNGLIGVQYYPESFLNSQLFTTVDSITEQSKYKSFMKSWNNQNYSGPSYQYNQYICNKLMDDSGEKYLYQNSNGTICAGLNFTEYDFINKIPNPYSIMTYDATYTFAHGLDLLLKSNLEFTIDNLMSLILLNISFTGVSGPIEFQKNKISNSGSRKTGIFYKLVNYQSNQSILNVGSFVTIGFWNEATNIQSCIGVSDCATAVIYRTIDNQLPNQSKDIIYITLSKNVQDLLIFLTFFVGIIAISLGAFFFINQKHKLIKAAQPIMIGCIIFGQILAAIKILVVALPINDFTCTFGLWIAHLAFVFVFGGLFVKTYRVHCIINAGK